MVAQVGMPNKAPQSTALSTLRSVKAAPELGRWVPSI